MRRPALLFLAWNMAGFCADLETAYGRYRKLDYRGALAEAASAPQSAAWLGLKGKAQFGLGEFEPAAAAFSQAALLDPDNSEWQLWLGRAHGRRAERASVFSAPGLAQKARVAFERAVELDGKNLDAVRDLFSYYVEAPGFLGGGQDKAAALAEKYLKTQDPVGYQTAMAELARKRKDHALAEKALRKAVDLAPRAIGPLVDLARFLGRQGRHKESDEVFARAEALNARSPALVFGKAESFIETGRNREQAKLLLDRYLKLPRTPDDPGEDEVRRLLKKVGD